MKCSTCFSRFLRPSSGVQTVCTTPGTLSDLYCYLPLSWKRWNSRVWALDDGRRNRLKHIEHFTEINKLCNVRSCWLHLKIRLRCTDPWTWNLQGLNLTYILVCHLAVHSEWSRVASLNILSKLVSLYVLCCQCLFRCTLITWTAMLFVYAVFDNVYIVWPVAEISFQSSFSFTYACYNTPCSVSSS